MASLALSLLPTLLPRSDQNQTQPPNYNNCTHLSDVCPIQGTIYGYRPSLPFNALFLGIFAASTGVHVFQGWHHKTWSFLIAMSIGGFCEVAGEVGRLLMHNNPYSDIGFKLQIVLLTFAPAFLAAGIYLQLKHLILTFGDSWSLIKPKLYTWIFISCDIFSIALQGAGGGIAAGSNSGDSIFAVGNNLTIAGLSFQVATLVLFGTMACEYVFRTVTQHRHELNPETEALRRSMGFKMFLGAIGLAYVTILIRCTYRVAELAGGWDSSNTIMHHEDLFLGLDSFMIAIAMISFNLYHPGRCFAFKRMGFSAKNVDSESELREFK